MTYTMVDTNITVLDSNELQTKYEDEAKIETDQFSVFSKQRLFKNLTLTLSIMLIFVNCILTTTVLLTIHNQGVQTQIEHDRTIQTKNQCFMQYGLIDGIKVSLCGVKGEKKIDIRLFLNGKSTIKGIQLNEEQWMDFMSYIPVLDYTVRNNDSWIN